MTPKVQGMRLVIGGYGGLLAAVELGAAGFGRPGPVGDAQNPSWVVPSAQGNVVYAALEREDGALTAWSTDDGHDWAPLGQSATGGAHPCHLALSPDGRFAVAANYSSGSVSVHAIGEDGSLVERTGLVRHSGPLGPVRSRQDGPHAHQVVFVDDTHLLACDLGLDAVIGYRLEPSGQLTEVARTLFAAGTGPRHLALSPDRATAYVVGELSSTVTVCAVNGLELEPGQTLGTRGRPVRDDVENLAAAVVLGSPAPGTPGAVSTLIVSNRGDDSVTTFDVGPGGSLTPATTFGSGGQWPRFAALTRDGRLVVANERSGLVCLFARDETGWVQRDAVSWPAPTCVAVLP